MTPMRHVLDLIVQLLSTIPKGRARLVVATLLSVCASGASVALMGVSAWLLSRAAEQPPVLYLLVAATGVRFFGVSRGVFRYCERLFGHDVALRMQSALRMRTYDSLSRTTLLGSRHGDLLTRVTSDVESIVDVVVRVAIPFASASVVILGTSAIFTIFSPSYAVLNLVICVVSGLLIPWLAARASRAADLHAVPANGQMADHVRELARCAPDMLAYGYEDQAQRKINTVDADLVAMEARGAWTRGIATGAQMIAAGISAISGLLIGSLAVIDGAMPARDLAVLVLTPLALHEVFGDFTKAAQTLTRVRAALGRVLDVITAEPVGTPNRADETPREGAASGAKTLRVTGASIGWPGYPTIVEGLDLDVAPGASVAIVGASGLGKTTLAATIMGLIEPKAGSWQIPNRIGYLAQDAHIFSTSLAENVKIGNKDATDEQIRSAMRLAGLSLDPARVVGEEGASLSGGEAQRVALARLLVAQNPAELVILDEPTEHLDRETAHHLLDDMFSSFASAALLVITHDEVLMSRCDRVIDLSRWAKTELR